LKRAGFILISLICFAASAQTDLGSLLKTTKGLVSVSEATSKIDAFLKTLNTNHADDRTALHTAFKKINKKFLRTYEAYSGFDELFSNGKFDCLTATALFSIVLERLDYSYELIETNYHIFLLVQTSKGEVLIETTDRFGGFVTDANAIEMRTGSYRKNALTAASVSTRYMEYTFKLYQPISPTNLNGLLYFNQAVKAYNQSLFVDAAELLEKANTNYSSPRCTEFGIVLLRAIVKSELEDSMKADCLRRLGYLLAGKQVAGLD
jgi:hypothetical protein